MNISRHKLPLVHDLITTLCTSSFEEPQIQNISQKICTILDAHYFALVLFPSNQRAHPLLISNNPPDFIPAYDSVNKEDFLAESLVHSGRECVMRRIPDWDGVSHRNFLKTLGSVRPASDGMYIPVKTNDGILRGFWAIARAKFNSPPFSDNDLEIFRFLAAFLSDAYERSLHTLPKEDDMAYLDSEGHILKAGERIQAIFDELFGSLSKKVEDWQIMNLELFLSRYKNFLQNTFGLYANSCHICFQNTNYHFIFKLLGTQNIFTHGADNPCALVGLIRDSEENGLVISSNFAFTKRELEVLNGIYRGMMNKEIARVMGVDESTVKRHTHNIYEKAGVHSRVELVLSMPPPYKNQL